MDTEADEKDDPLTRAFIGAALEVHRIMGPGLLESVYQRSLEEELRLRGIPALEQQRVPLHYKSVQLEDYLILDFVIPGQLIVEIKAVERMIPVHEAQLLSYMRLVGVPKGLLINFNVPLLREGIKRRVL
jgi:GxxExxY protein